MINTTLASVDDFDSFPLLMLFLSVVWVVVLIARFKLHPFLAMMSGAILVGILSGPLPDPNIENKGLFHSRVDLQQTDAPHANWTLAVKWSLLGFGNIAGGIGLIIALAAIVGTCMMKSGAAERIVRHLLSVFGEKRAGLVLLLSGFLLSIPVFFDTVFFLLIPLARAMAIRSGGKYLFFVIAMAGAGAITHSMVPPTPGPLMIADFLKIEIGYALMAGLMVSIPLACLVLWVGAVFEKKYSFPMREIGGISNEELENTLAKKLDDLPPLFLSYLPILLPVLLISFVSCLKVLEVQGFDLGRFSPIQENPTFRVLSFLGEPNIAMSLAALVSVFLLIRQMKGNEPRASFSLNKTLEAPLITAGTIILITGAGGAYGGMIRLSGVGEVIAQYATQMSISYVILAWGITAFIRIAQGSATVAMITGAGLMASIINDGGNLPYHPVYIFLAIGFGSITLSWMNDSGFWVVQKLSGFTENEMLRTWSLLLTIISVAGLVISLVGSNILPLR
jgi:GntP family gluconate:H+ symporter